MSCFAALARQVEHAFCKEPARLEVVPVSRLKKLSGEYEMDPQPSAKNDFPVSAGIFFGLGLGGFFDGIVLHQILQWHHMLTSAGYPPDTIGNLAINTFWDGIFHAGTYLFVITGLTILWRAARKQHVRWSGAALPAAILIGFGLFNLVEGGVNHHLLGLHHVNEMVPQEQWIYWDIAFLVWGALMLAGGWLLLRNGQGESPRGGYAGTESRKST
jgi:uncharacterized membrane protein